MGMGSYLFVHRVKTYLTVLISIFKQSNETLKTILIKGAQRTQATFINVLVKK